MCQDDHYDLIGDPVAKAALLRRREERAEEAARLAADVTNDPRSQVVKQALLKRAGKQRSSVLLARFESHRDACSTCRAVDAGAVGSSRCATGMDLLRAAEASRKEVEFSERVLQAVQQLADARALWGECPFGYEGDRVVIRASMTAASVVHWIKQMDEVLAQDDD